MEKFLSRFFNIPVYHPKKTIVFLIAVTVLLGLGLPGLEFENSLSGMMPRHDIEYVTNENVKAVYGNNGKFIIIDVSSGSMMSRDTFIRTDNLITDIEEFRNYNDELERSRIKRVSAIDAGQGIDSAELLVMFEADDPVFSRTLSRKIKKLFYENKIIYKSELNKIISELENTRAVKEKKYVDEILSPFTMKGLSGKDDTLITYDLMSMDSEGRRILPETEKEFMEFEAVLRHNPAYLKGIVAREIFEIAGSYNSSDLRVLTQGEPVLYKQIYDYMQSDLMFFVPLVLLVISVIFFLNFGTLQGVLVPLATLIMADIWLLGLMGHLGFRLSVLGISLPPLMISVGSSYSIHIINRFLIDKESIALDRKAGLHGSMKTIGMTLFLASITTVIGFATNMATQVSSIFEWGVFAAIGTFFAVFIAALFVPAVFSFVEIRTSANIINTILKWRSKNNSSDKAGAADRIVEFLAGIAVKHHRAVLAAAMIFAVISTAGVFRIRTETSLPSYFKADDYINTSSVEIGEKFGGTMGLNILINTKNADGVKSSEFLNRVERARDWLVSAENSDLHIGRTDAFG
ncbi:MAG: hypothetical protein CVV49_07285, partial [Spirochaetae bacterium HGW-Spirochaetae-5]